MTNIFKVRNVIIGIITLSIGVIAAVGIVKALSFQTTTVSGKVVSFILSPKGKVDGAILETGDQVTFGEQAGELVAAQIKVGDSLSATGNSGSSSVHGRELHAKTLQIGEQTITVAVGKPHHDKDEKGKKHGPKGEKPEPKDIVKAENTLPVEEVASKETGKTSSNVKYVLVNGNGESRGLILADGTQIHLPKEVKDAGFTFDETSAISVEGEIMKSQFGNFIKPTVLTIGNQTFTFNR